VCKWNNLLNSFMYLTFVGYSVHFCLCANKIITECNYKIIILIVK